MSEPTKLKAIAAGAFWGGPAIAVSGLSSFIFVMNYFQNLEQIEQTFADIPTSLIPVFFLVSIAALPATLLCLGLTSRSAKINWGTYLTSSSAIAALGLYAFVNRPI